MKQIIFIIMMLMVVFSAGCTDLPSLETLSLSGTPVPVTFGWEENPTGIDDGNYWVGTARISGDTTKYTLTLPDGETAGPATAQEDVIIQISGINTVWTAPLEEDTTPLQYYEMDPTEWWNVFASYHKVEKDVPYYNVAPIGQRLNANVVVTVSVPDRLTPYTATVTNYDTNPTAKIKVKDPNGIERTIFFKFQGIAFRGELPPSGDLSVVKTAGSNYQLVTYNELEGGVNAWNGPGISEIWGTPVGYYYDYYNMMDDWGDVYNYMSGNGYIRDRSPPNTFTTITTGTDAKVSIAYDTTVFAPDVTFYIPAELADTVTINEQTPEFDFDDIGKIEGVEGGSYRLTVSGTAEGTGTIRLSVDSPAVKYADWVEGAEQNIVAGRDYEFHVDLEFNTALDANKEFDARIISTAGGFGTSTDEEFTIYLTDKDTANTYNVRVYAIYENTGKKVESAPLFIGYGSDKKIGLGDSTKSGVVEGTYQVYSENVTGWYAAYTVEHPNTVEINKDRSIEILFTKEPPAGRPLSIAWWLPVGVIIVLFSLFYVYMGGPGAGQIKQFSQPVLKILSYPQFWIFLAILLVAIVAWLIYQDASGKIDDLTNAIEEFKVI